MKTLRLRTANRMVAAIRCGLVDYGVQRRKDYATDKMELTQYQIDVRFLPAGSSKPIWKRKHKPLRPLGIWLANIIAAVIILIAHFAFAACILLAVIWKCLLFHISEPLEWRNEKLRAASAISLVVTVCAVVFAILWLKQ